jgi:hypothetical protein
MLEAKPDGLLGLENVLHNMVPGARPTQAAHDQDWNVLLKWSEVIAIC